MIDVLLVDDEDAILEITQTYLESDGDIYAKTAGSALEAIKLLGHWDYDMVICDYAMPGGSGIELLKALRRRGNKVPFLLFTAKERSEVEGELSPYENCFILQKGASVKSVLPHLKRTVRERVRHSRLEASQGREGHIKSILDTYVHDDEALEAGYEEFEDPVPNWMRGNGSIELEDAGAVLEDQPYVTLTMLANVPARRLRKGAVAQADLDPAKDKARLVANGSGSRFGGGLKLLREDVGLREAKELIRIKDEPRYDR